MKKSNHGLSQITTLPKTSRYDYYWQNALLVDKYRNTAFVQ